jgi:hypothetical protein
MSRFSVPRHALLLSAAVLLVTACKTTDAPQDNIAGPANFKPKGDITVVVDRPAAGNVVVCIGVGSPAGTYVLTSTVGAPGEGPPGHGTLTSPASITLPGNNCATVFNRDQAEGPFGDTQSLVTTTVTSKPSNTGVLDASCILDNGTNQPVDCAEPDNTQAIEVKVYANAFHGTQVAITFVGPPPECNLGYPDNSNPPKSQALFNEDEVLSAFGRTPTEIRVWYTDEHALLLGVRANFTDNKAAGTDVTQNHFIATMAMNPTGAGTASFAAPPSWFFGSATWSGPFAATDPAGRILSPVMYVTDITSNPASRSGDWQQGGFPKFPTAIYGSWKAAVAKLDNTKNPAVSSIVLDADPATKNHKNVGPGGVNPPDATQDFGYSTEIVYSIASLGLDPTHNYRLQFMVHDGDQNKTGGDVGQACFNVGPGTPEFFVTLSGNTK